MSVLPGLFPHEVGRGTDRTSGRRGGEDGCGRGAPFVQHPSRNAVKAWPADLVLDGAVSGPRSHLRGESRDPRVLLNAAAHGGFTPFHTAPRDTPGAYPDGRCSPVVDVAPARDGRGHGRDGGCSPRTSRSVDATSDEPDTVARPTDRAARTLA